MKKLQTCLPSLVERLPDEQQIESYRKDISFTASLRGRDYRFNTTWGVFSPREIDSGTRLLLDRLEISEHDNCLDLGCGYGPLGVVLASEASAGKTLLLDKDFVAVNYSNANLAQNGCGNAKAVLSNGFDAVKEQGCWDLIVSNVPAKVGKEMLSIYLYDALQLLAPDGKLYVVTINGLRQYMKRNLTEMFGNYKKLKQGSHYTVALATKKS